MGWSAMVQHNFVQAQPSTVFCKHYLLVQCYVRKVVIQKCLCLVNSVLCHLVNKKGCVGKAAGIREEKKDDVLQAEMYLTETCLTCKEIKKWKARQILIVR